MVLIASTSARRGFSGAAPSSLTLRLVGEARVEIADLLRGAAGLLVLVAGQFLDQRVEIGLGLVGQLDERAVDGADPLGSRVLASHVPLT